MFKKATLKPLSVIAAVFLVASLICGGAYVLALSPGDCYPGASAYTVWKNGSTYYAIDKYGTMIAAYPYGDSSASVIINACVSALSAGGEITICEGNFACTGTIYVNGKTIHFKGTGQGDYSHGGTILSFANGVNGFEINSGSTTYTPSVTIEGLLLRNGTGTPGTAIKSKGQYLTVSDVVIENFAVGISLEMGSGCSAGDSLIDNCVIRWCQYEGVKIASNDNRMSNVIIHQCENGLKLVAEGGLNAVNVHCWGNRDNGLKITKSVNDYFCNFQSETNTNYGVFIGNLEGYVTNEKFSNVFIWDNGQAALSLSGNGGYQVQNVTLCCGATKDPIWTGDGVVGFARYALNEDT